MPYDYEARYVRLREEMERVAEDAARQDKQAGQQIRDRIDAASPVLDDVQDLLASLDEAARETERQRGRKG